MKTAIMQPYLFPYIGYWQLIHAVDQFVLLDDVNYIRRGFINRNSILLEGKPYRFTIPVRQASQNRLIRDMELDFDREKKDKFLKTIHSAYRKAPCYEAVYSLIEEIIHNEEYDLTGFIEYSIRKIMAYLHMDTEVMLSSGIPKKEGLRGEERILEICRRLGTDTYINPCGGRELYSQAHFREAGICLYFLDTQKEQVIYRQGQDEFTENLSILDILMFNDVEAVLKLLERYELNE